MGKLENLQRSPPKNIAHRFIKAKPSYNTQYLNLQIETDEFNKDLPATGGKDQDIKKILEVLNDSTCARQLENQTIDERPVKANTKINL